MRSAARVFRRSSRGTLVLTLALGLLLNLGTLQILVQSREFAPNQKNPRANALRTAYWPESPVSTGELGDPLADWLGLEEYLTRASLQDPQIEALRPLEDRALEAAETALEGYTRLLEPLTPSQRRKLAEPQPGVVDHKALGLDSAGLDQILVWLHRLDERAHGAREPAPAQSPPPSPMRMAPTRLAVSMTRLLGGSPTSPLTPGPRPRATSSSAKSNSERPWKLLHNTHAQARRVLTVAQRQEALSLPLRRWEPFPSPRALDLFIRSVQERRKEGPGT